MFTHFLLQGLKGGITVDRSDGLITLEDIYQFTLEKVRSWSIKNNTTQVPSYSAELTGVLSEIAVARVRPDLDHSVATAEQVEMITSPFSLSEMVFTGVRDFRYLTDVEHIPTPYDWMNTGISYIGPRTREVIVAREEIDNEAEGYGEGLLSECGALLLKCFEVEEIKGLESNRIDFPKGHFSISTEKYHRKVIVTHTLNLAGKYDGSELCRAFFNEFSWGLLELRLTIENAKTLENLVGSFRLRDWEVVEYLPDNYLKVHVPSLGKGSSPAAVRIENERNNRWNILYYLFEIDSAHGPDTLVKFVYELFEIQN